MVLFPGMFSNSPPAVYGPVKYPVKKLADGTYFIEGYGSKFEGTPREIAKQILLNIIYHPEPGPRQGYTGPFATNLKPEPYVYFCLIADPDPKELDVKALSQEITKEFKSLAKLITFS